MLRSAAILSLVGFLGVSSPALAKEYNKRPFADPATSAKLNKALAASRNAKSKYGGTVLRGDVVNTGCGELSVGNVKEARPGARINNEVIIKGDIINAPRNCR